MKNTIKTLGFILGATLVLSSCTRYSQTKIYTANQPVYVSYEELRTPVQNSNDQALIKPGKILVHNNYIYINDFEQGIHIYDNSNISSPEHVAFISIPGNVDMAIDNNILFADSYIDIVAIDISNPENVTEVTRENDALSYTIPATMNYDYPVSNIDRTKGVVVGYKVGDVEETCKNEECGYKYYDATAVHYGDWSGSMMSEEGTVVNFADNSNTVRSLTASNTQGAIAGSMARFLMIDGYLYVIADRSTVKVYSVSGGSLSLTAEFNPWTDGAGWGEIETLFRINDHLLIGSTTGMMAYDISSPNNPEYLSVYDHMTSCDPVVADDNHAFITLRSGVDCGRVDINQLDVVNIENIMNPYLVNSVQLSHPHGLSLDDDADLLFVCDGENGMHVYDMSNAESFIALATRSGDAYDAIANNGILQIIGDGGLVQYEYAEDGQLVELSRINLD